MGIYADIEITFATMIRNLVKDEELMKLIYYDGTDPLSQSPVDNPKKVIYNGRDEEDEVKHRIYLVEKLPEVVNAKKTFIIPTLEKTNAVSGAFYMDFTIEFNIATHISIKSLDDEGDRILKIMDRIHSFYNRTLQDYALSQSQPLGSWKWNPSDKWRGRTMRYRFTSSNMDCGE